MVSEEQSAIKPDAYPKRDHSVFALKFMKWLYASGAAAEIGPDATALLLAVVSAEDDLKYSYRPNFFNDQLMRRCGIRSEHAMIRARQTAIDAGLLSYEPGAKRSPGKYFVCGFAAQNAEKAERKQNESEEKARRNQGPPDPNPDSDPDPDPEKKTRRKPVFKFSEEDMALAEWSFAKIAQTFPVRKQDLPKWADTIRLMRSRDNVNEHQLREALVYACSDEFWRAVIDSPMLLRKKYSKIVGQMVAKRRSRPSHSAGVHYQEGLQNDDTM